jgi:hypothetical protein
MTFCWEPNNLPYLTRVLDLPPLVAQAAFAAVRSTRTCQNHPAVWEIGTAAGRLELHGDGRVAPPPRPCYWSYRHVPGRIRSLGWQPAIPVGVELVPWSATRTALGLHLVAFPLLYADERLYLEVGHAALETLAADLEAWALHDLTTLERSFRSRSLPDRSP